MRYCCRSWLVSCSRDLPACNGRHQLIRGDRMNRREFIILLGCADANWILIRYALAVDLPRISILHSGFPNRTPIHVLFEELRTLGYDQGRTAMIDLYGAEGDSVRLNGFVEQ